MRVLALALVVCGCDALSSTTQAVAILSAVPDLALTEQMNADILPALPPQLQQQGTAIFVGVGQRNSATSTNTPTAVTGASVILEFRGQQVDVCEGGSPGGIYQASSLEGDDCSRPALIYSPATTYKLFLDVAGAQSEVEVVAPAAISRANVVYTPALGSPAQFSGFPRHPLHGPLRVDWSADIGELARNVFVTVFRARYIGGQVTQLTQLTDQGNWQGDESPVFDTTPRSASDIFDLVTHTPATAADIPGSTFDSTGVYVVVITAATLSTTSTGLSLGSGFLAGAGIGFTLWAE